MGMKVNPRHFSFAVEALVASTAQAGSGANTIVLNAADTGTDRFYNRMYIAITSGVDISQVREIILYDLASKTATVDKPWTGGVPPAAGDGYAIFAALTEGDFYGIAQAGAANAITLADGESVRDGFYEDLDIEIVGGAGFSGAQASQRHRIVNYVGATRVATIGGSPWTTNPAAGSTYRIQRHLYFRMSDLEIYEVNTATLRFAQYPGGIAFGTNDVGSRFGPGVWPIDVSYMEVAIDAGGAGTLKIRRWE